jgi:hypothetical protein
MKLVYISTENEDKRKRLCLKALEYECYPTGVNDFINCAEYNYFMIKRSDELWLATSKDGNNIVYVNLWPFKMVDKVYSEYRYWLDNKRGPVRIFNSDLEEILYCKEP